MLWTTWDFEKKFLGLWDLLVLGSGLFSGLLVFRTFLFLWFLRRCRVTSHSPELNRRVFQGGSGELPRLHADSGSLPTGGGQREEQERFQHGAAQQQDEQAALWESGSPSRTPSWRTFQLMFSLVWFVFQLPSSCTTWTGMTKSLGTSCCRWVGSEHLSLFLKVVQLDHKCAALGPTCSVV